MPDTHANFAYSTVAVAPAPATSGTSVTLQSGDGAKFPSVGASGGYNVTMWPAGVQPTTANAEIARVTAKASDTLTIVRAQEGSTAQAVTVGYQIEAGITAKTLQDVEPDSLTITTTGTVNDYAPGIGTNTPTYIRCNNATDLVLTGLSASGVSDGQMVVFESIGAGNVYFKHQNAGSQSANRFFNMATSADTPISGGRAAYRYDATSGYWRLIQHEQGAWITPTFNAANFTGSGSMTWTVAAGNIQIFRWRLSGKSIQIAFEILSTSVGGTLNQVLQIGNGAWGGFTATNVQGTYMYNDAGTGYVIGGMQNGGSATTIGCFKIPVANWSAATSSTIVSGMATVEVS